MSVGTRVGSPAACVDVAGNGGDWVASGVAVACVRVAAGSVAGVTGVGLKVGAKVAVALGTALLQAESSRTRKRKVSFFILSIVQMNLILVNPL